MSRLRALVGLSGPPAVGKTTAAQRLTDSGWKAVAFSDVIKSMGPPGIDIQELALAVHRQFGQQWICRKALRTLADFDWGVIDGIRFIEDMRFFRTELSERFLHVHLTASPEKRRGRFVTRGGTLVDFRRRESDVFHSEVRDVAKYADVHICTDGALKEWCSALTAITEAFRKSLGQADRP